jgi:hypothetical protein
MVLLGLWLTDAENELLGDGLTLADGLGLTLAELDALTLLDGL